MRKEQKHGHEPLLHERHNKNCQNRKPRVSDGHKTKQKKMTRNLDEDGRIQLQDNWTPIFQKMTETTHNWKRHNLSLKEKIFGPKHTGDVQALAHCASPKTTGRLHTKRPK